MECFMKVELEELKIRKDVSAQDISNPSESIWKS